ncbi:MAG: N-6 DNA methylase [Pseudomonadota bacterium]|nr:N-6 DNA methylase [Pseudomonadota bacterium]
MRLDWNDIKARAAAFAGEWKDAQYERGDTQTFYNEFFELFGVTRRRVASFEHGVDLPDKKRGYLDLFWKGKLLVEQKSAGRSLTPARRQALDYFPGLKEHELPRYILLSDFQNFELYDLDIAPDRPVCFRLPELPDHVQDFGFIAGQERRVFRDQDPVNILASEIMGALHDALDEAGYRGHKLERFLVRLLFCLFADDTGIFQPLGIFEEFIKDRTREDGADLGPMLSKLFEVLDTPETERGKKLDGDLSRFDYINGELFHERLPLPDFDRAMREKLLYACSFNWEKISPAIFGSLFQSVMNKVARRKQGAHYTSEKNILKVIEPLFLDDLKGEFFRLKARKDTGRRRALEDFHERLGNLTFFDPACGCGNFLVIAYRELRELEIAVLKELHPGEQRVTDIGLYTKVDVDRFYGIEIGEFPARIAEVAMWMTDHIMNARLSAAFGESFVRIPLKTSPNILNADALETDWANVLAPEKCSYILGNPPFGGFVQRDEARQDQMAEIAKLGLSGNRLDYVCAWFVKAGEYVRGGEGRGWKPPRIGFVATNSITQGEQVAQLWPLLFERYGLEITFAHRTFAWMSDARGKAHVHCVIIGLTRRDDEPKEKRLFSYDDIKSDPHESCHAALTPYLFDAGALADRHLVVKREMNSLSSFPKLCVGTKPVDGGHYIFNDSERASFLREEPLAINVIHPFLGSEEFINGISRWILYSAVLAPGELRSMPRVMARIADVRRHRVAASGKLAQSLAQTPALYHVTVVPDAPFLVIPEVSSERRDYVPIGYLEPPTIPSNKLLVMRNADLCTFGLLTSRMHMAWTRIVGGRLKSDFQYSVGINYNPFPWPQLDDAAKTKLEKLAQVVLDARAAHEGATLADLYDPDVMPEDLRKAHRALDEAVDRLYRKEPFASDRERVEHLFGLYEKLTAPMLAAAKPKRGRKR